MSSIRTINLTSVKPDLDDLPVNRDLLTAFMAANGLLATIPDFDDADEIRAQTAGLRSIVIDADFGAAASRIQLYSISFGLSLQTASWHRPPSLDGLHEVPSPPSFFYDQS